MSGQGSGSKEEILQIGRLTYRMPVKCGHCAGFGKLMVPRDKAKRKRVDSMTVVDACCKVWLRSRRFSSHFRP